MKLPAIFGSEFFKNVSFQMVGTGIAQVLPFLLSPLLTRLYSQEDFAMYTAFFALSSILVVGVGGRYHFAIVIPKEDQKASRLFFLSLWITVGYSLALGVIFFFINQMVDGYYGRVLFFIPPYVLFFGLWTSYSYWSVRFKTFFHNATAKVLQSIAYVALSVVLGFLRVPANGLILGRIAGSLASLIYLRVTSSRLPTLPTTVNLKNIAKEYRNYPYFGLFPAFLDVASVQGVVLIISRFYSKEDLGYFGLTSLVLTAPLALIGGSFRDVFFQKIAALLTERQPVHARSLFIRSAAGLAAVGIPISAIIFFFGPQLFSLVFGEAWGRSGEFAAIIAFSFLVQLIVSPLSSVFNAANQLKIAAVWQTLYFCTTFSVLGVAATFLELSIERLLTVYVFHEIVLYSIYFTMQFRTLKRIKA